MHSTNGRSMRYPRPSLNRQRPIKIILKFMVMEYWKAVVRPSVNSKWIPEEWVFDMLEGDTHEERMYYLINHLIGLGVLKFKMTHYSRVDHKKVQIHLEDICLN